MDKIVSVDIAAMKCLRDDVEKAKEKIRETLSKELREIIKDLSYSEVSNYLELLPSLGTKQERLFYYGVSYINEYYKKTAKLESQKNDENNEMLTNVQLKLYTLYNLENFNNVHLSFEEFIIFSVLLDKAFTDYQPTKKRKNDKIPYNSGDSNVDDLVNQIAYNCNHSEKEYAYEISPIRLEILLQVLNERITEVLVTSIKDLDIESSLDYLNLQKKDEIRRRIKTFYKKDE